MAFEKEIALVLKSRTDSSDMSNVVEVLGGAYNFQQAFDVALEMENLNLVKLLYSNFNANKVIVEFTLIGKNKSISI